MAHSTDTVRQYLADSTDTATATAYVTGLGLTVAALRTLASELGVFLPGQCRKAEIVRQIVHWRVGVRLNSLAIRTPYYAR